MSVKKITYEQLKAIAAERAGQPEMFSAKGLANGYWALTDFVKERGFRLHDQVGPTLREGFAEIRAAHLEELRGDGRAITYVSNRSALLGRWHRVLRVLEHEGAAIDGTTTPLQQALRDLFKTRKVKPIARQLAIPLATIPRWLAGALPRRGTEHYLRRLEVFVEMKPGALTDLLPYNPMRRAGDDSPGERLPYRELLAAQVKAPFRLSARLAPAAFRTEWCALLTHKTSTQDAEPAEPAEENDLFNDPFEDDDGLDDDDPFDAADVDDKSLNKRWRLRVAEPHLLEGDRWVDIIDGQICHSAECFFGHVASLLGWAHLPRDRGGRDLPLESLTLGLFASKPLLRGYMKWRRKRSGGVMNHGMVVFVQLAKMLLHAETGFLPAHSELGERVRIDDPVAWRDRCWKTFKWLDYVRKRIKPSIKMSRDPRDPLKAALDLEMPLEHFVTGAKRLEAARPSTGGLIEAIWARDLLLLTLTMSNPLRLLNLKALTYRADNTGHLRKTPAGEWRIVINRKYFKNVKGAAKHKDYDQAVDAAVWPYIERYLKNYLALFHGTRDLVFVSSTEPDRQWASLGRHYEVLTRRYVPGCPGVGPHSIRHIVASSIILAGGGVSLAADTLHDREGTVMAHYELLLASHGDRGRKKTLGGAMQRLSRQQSPRGPAAPAVLVPASTDSPIPAPAAPLADLPENPTA